MPYVNPHPVLEEAPNEGKNCALGIQQEAEFGGHSVPNERSPHLPPDIRNARASHHLDFIRSLAAFAVLAYHIRYRFFVDYQDLEVKSLLAKVFYFLTAFGHDAVMVFFVLSGFLISSTVIRDTALEKWSWSKYGADRMTRLYVVVIPGLLLTIAWDLSGLQLFGTNAIYTGEATGWVHDYFDVKSRLTFSSLVGNASFLQTIFVAPFGSNDPLWSLSYEFWYYLLFPCLFIGLVNPKSTTSRVLLLFAAIAMLFLVGKAIAIYFPIWLMGTAVCYIPKLRCLANPRVHRVAVCGSLLLFGSLMVAGHVGAVKHALGASSFFVIT